MRAASVRAVKPFPVGPPQGRQDAPPAPAGNVCPSGNGAAPGRTRVALARRQQAPVSRRNGQGRLHELKNAEAPERIRVFVLLCRSARPDGAKSALPALERATKATGSARFRPVV